MSWTGCLVSACSEEEIQRTAALLRFSDRRKWVSDDRSNRISVRLLTQRESTKSELNPKQMKPQSPVCSFCFWQPELADELNWGL